MEILRSLRKGNILLSFLIKPIYLFHHHESLGKVKDKEHLKLRCLVQVGPEVVVPRELVVLLCCADAEPTAYWIRMPVYPSSPLS